jgi:hypothetical protein
MNLVVEAIVISEQSRIEIKQRKGKYFLYPDGLIVNG